MAGVRIDETYSLVASVVRILAIVEHILPQSVMIEIVLNIEFTQIFYIYIYYFHNHSI